MPFLPIPPSGLDVRGVAVHTQKSSENRVPAGWLVIGGMAAGAVLGYLGWIWVTAGLVLVAVVVAVLSRRDGPTPRRSASEAPDQKRQDTLNRAIGQSEDIELVSQDLVHFVALVEEITQESETAASSAQGASQQVADSATSVASAAEQMSAAMNEVARSAARATQVTSQADGQATEVKESAQRLVTSMAQIDGVLRTITTISAQTKLLALNATIEAARAGDSGKGFAVVAEEVKQLASQTDEAAQTITRQLSDLVTESQAVQISIAEIAGVFQDIDALQQSIAVAVEEQSSAISEITRSATQAATAASHLDSVALVTAESVQRTSQATRSANAWVERLSTTVRDQHSMVASLLDRPREQHPVRAAITAHDKWKHRLRAAIATGRVERNTDLAAIARDDVCDFGRWLHGEARAITDPALLRRVVEAHTAFHRETAGVFAAVAEGDLSRAKRLLMDRDGYAGALDNLTDLLLSWTRDLSI
jgi:methyl-accepting chemotaxis protein